jgi:hypothetical protein
MASAPTLGPRETPIKAALAVTGEGGGALTAGLGGTESGMTAQAQSRAKAARAPGNRKLVASALRMIGMLLNFPAVAGWDRLSP